MVANARQQLILGAIAFVVATLTSCGQATVPETIDFELTGKVLEEGTKQPIEGAYVIAIYKGVTAGSDAVVSRCIKTKGMYTGKDGKFHFPVEKRDGYSPWSVEAIHPDYSMWTFDIKPDRIHKLQKAEAYTDRNVYMKSQDPAKPIFVGNDVYCAYAKNPDDVAASVEFFKIKKIIHTRYGSRKDYLDNIDSIIHDLQTLDGRPPDAIRADVSKPKN